MPVLAKSWTKQEIKRPLEFGSFVSSAPLAQPARSVCAEDLCRVAVFADLPAADLEQIAAASSFRKVCAGEEIALTRGEIDYVCFSLSTRFRVIILSPSGRQVIIRTVRAGGHFGELAVLAGVSQQDTSILAETSGEYIEIPGPQFVALIAKMPALASGMLYATARLAAGQVNRIFELSTMDLRHRLQAEIVRLAQFGNWDGQRVVIRPAPTHEDFAHLVGGTREGVTRELRAVAEQGLIDVKRKEIVVHNISQLRLALCNRWRSGFPALLAY